jgi:hypothetical protein
MRQAALESAEPRRMEIFRLLVSAQDMDMTVAESRQYIMHRFGVPESEVRQIERQGVAGRWPPL